MSSAAARHPIFARCFDRLSHAIEDEVGPCRDELLAGLAGRVVEVGAGNGINFAHYPSAVEAVTAIEPEPYLRAKATAAAERAAVPVTVLDAAAEALPLPDGSCEGAVACLVLCSVPDQPTALAELRRVLRPGGELRFFEHVVARGSPRARVQSLLDSSGVWPLLGGGCHCARDTLAAVRAAGFTVERSRDVDVGPSWTVTNPHVLGVARLA
jgi:ubiquinone/menaquinone biosynthesis C-methylase UbiE